MAEKVEVALSWFKWFGFNADPFFVKPLEAAGEFADLMVKTKVVSKDIDYWPSVAETQPFTKLVIGHRGLGKSTLLRYASHVFRKSGMQSIYFGVPTFGIDPSHEPIFNLTREVIRGCLQELIRTSAEAKPEFFTKFKDTFVKWGKYAGLTYSESDGFVLDPIRENVDLYFLMDMLKSFIELTNRNNIKILLSIDNLDKLAHDILKGFLRAAVSQGLFEMLNSNGASLAIAMDPQKIESAWKSEDLSYLRGDYVKLEPLSPKEAEALIELRVKKFSQTTAAAKNPFNAETIYAICNKQKGITREILIDAKQVCQQAFGRRILTITKENLEKLRVPGGISIYYQLIEDREARIGAERLLAFVEMIEEQEYDEAMHGILDLFSHTGSAKFSAWTQEQLINECIVETESGMYRLSSPVSSLLSLAEKRGLRAEEFLRWFFQKETVEIIRVDYPALTSKRKIEYLLNTISALLLTNPEVQIILKQEDGESIVKQSSEFWFKQIIRGLRQSKSRYNIFDSASREDTTNLSLCETIHYATKDFLQAFSRFFAAVGCSPPLSVRRYLPDLDTWDFIWPALTTYQQQYGVTFRTWKYIRYISDSYHGAKRGGYTIDETEISRMQEMFDEIVLEMSAEWEQLIVRNKSALHELEPESGYHKELHEAMRSCISELFERMGYVDRVDQYRTFKVDPMQYKRRGFFKSATDVAEIDIVRRRQEPNRKDGKIRHQYVFCEVKRGGKKSHASDVLCFLQKCGDLALIVDKDSASFPQILKPEYLFYFVSYSGFDESVARTLPRTEIPLRSKLELLNLHALNRKLKEYNLSTLPYKTRVD